MIFTFFGFYVYTSLSLSSFSLSLFSRDLYLVDTPDCNKRAKSPI